MALPTGSLRLNRRHPLARGLITAIPFFSAHNARVIPDVVQGRQARLVAGSPTFGVDAFGPRVACTAGVAFEVASFYPPLGTAARTTALWVSTNASGVSMLGYGNVVSGQTWAMTRDANNYFRLAVHNGWARVETVLTNGQVYFLVGVLPVGVTTTAGIKLYINGVEQVIAFSLRTINTTTTEALRFGDDPTTTPNMDGNFYDAKIWNRALTAAEIWQLYDPATRWDLYEPIAPSRVVYPPAVALTGSPWYHSLQQRVTA